MQISVDCARIRLSHCAGIVHVASGEQGGIVAVHVPDLAHLMPLKQLAQRQLYAPPILRLINLAVPLCPKPTFHS